MKLRLLLTACLCVSACGDDAGVDDAGVAPDATPGDIATLPDGGVLTDTGPVSDAGPIVDDGLHPVISGFRVADTGLDRMYFDSSEVITAADAAGFTISGKTISGVTVNASQLTGHYFTVLEPFDHWDNNTIRYEGGSDLADAEANALHPFTLEYIENDIPEPAGSGTTYYVDVATGSDSDSGVTEEEAWATIAHGASQLRAGDTLYVKAGAYGDENAEVSADGTVSNPIRIIGYRDTPGDITSMYYDHVSNGSPDPTEMPFLDAGEFVGTAFAIGGDYVILKNLSFEGYYYPVSMGGDGSAVHNSIVYRGRSGFTASNDPNTSRRDGLPDSRNRFINNIIIDGNRGGLRMMGNFNLMEGNIIAATPGRGADYNTNIRGSNSIIKDNRIEDANEANGHGFSLHAQFEITEYNLIVGCWSGGLNNMYELRHEDVRYNVVKRSTAAQANGLGTIGINIRDNASFNTIEDFFIEDVPHAIRFYDQDGEEGVQPAAHDNVFRNIHIRNVTNAILHTNPLTITNNSFDHITVVGATRFYQGASRYPNNMDATNSVTNALFVNVEEHTGSGSTSMTETYSNYFAGFGMSDGTGNVAIDPRLDSNGVPQNVALRAGIVGETKYDFAGAQFEATSPTIGAYRVP